MSHGAVCRICGSYFGIMYYCGSCGNTFCETHIPSAGIPSGGNSGPGAAASAKAKGDCVYCGKGTVRKIQG